MSLTTLSLNWGGAFTELFKQFQPYASWLNTSDQEYIMMTAVHFLENGSIAGCVLKEISSAGFANKLRGIKVIRTSVVISIYLHKLVPQSWAVSDYLHLVKSSLGMRLSEYPHIQAHQLKFFILFFLLDYTFYFTTANAFIVGGHNH